MFNKTSCSQNLTRERIQLSAGVRQAANGAIPKASRGLWGAGPRQSRPSLAARPAELGPGAHRSLRGGDGVAPATPQQPRGTTPPPTPRPRPGGAAGPGRPARSRPAPARGRCPASSPRGRGRASQGRVAPLLPAPRSPPPPRPPQARARPSSRLPQGRPARSRSPCAAAPRGRLALLPLRVGRAGGEPRGCAREAAAPHASAPPLSAAPASLRQLKDTGPRAVAAAAAAAHPAPRSPRLFPPPARPAAANSSRQEASLARLRCCQHTPPPGHAPAGPRPPALLLGHLPCPRLASFVSLLRPVDPSLRPVVWVPSAWLPMLQPLARPGHGAEHGRCVSSLRGRQCPPGYEDARLRHPLVE